MDRTPLRHGGLAAACALLLCAAGCTHPNTLKEVVFWALGAEGEHVMKLMPEFERRNPGITVRVQMIPWNAAHEKLLTAFAGRSLPDMGQIGNTWVPEFHLLNAIENLDPWIARSDMVQESSYFAGIWDTNVLESNVFGLPWYVDTRLLFYRSDLLARVGYRRAPTSWREWFDVSRKLRDLGKGRDRYAIFLPTNNEWAPPVVMGLEKGAKLLRDRNTRGNFSSTEFRSALAQFHRFFEEGLAPVKTTQIVNVFQAFAEGFFAMYITGPWNIQEFARRLPPELQGSWMTAPMPGPDSSIGVSLAGGSSLVMFSSSDRKEEVWKVMEYLSEPSVQREFYRITADLPARREAWQDSVLANNRYTRAFFDQLNHVVATPKVPEWEQIAQKVREYSELVSMDRLTVDQATTALDRDVDQILEKRRWMLHER
jgi:multiple sugar transport system substrate-binding protein